MSRLVHRRGSTAFILGFGLIAAAGGCDCGDDIVKQTSCKTDEDCAGLAATEQVEKFCDLKVGVCMDLNKVCTLDYECCPGQVCGAAGGGSCNDTYTACQEDSSCTVKGQKCKEIGMLPAGKGCTFDRAVNGKCAAGLSPFNGFCVGEPPCENGTCPAGSACVPANNKCHPIKPKSAGGDPTCEQSCDDGFLLVYSASDYDDVFNRCNPKAAMACDCEPLPPVAANDLARHSSATVAGDKILVAAYDGTLVPNGVHGDLILHTYAKSSLAFEKTEWLDGLPTTGNIYGDPTGPRGGRVAPGPDVGQYTSIAYDPSGSVTHIAYYAKADGANPLGDLRYARRSGTGAFQFHVVDGSSMQGTTRVESGDVGLYASLTLAPDGAPVIAYFQRGGIGADKNTTALKVARAKKKDPASAADWTIVTVQTGTKTATPCTVPQSGNPQFDAENKQCKETGVCTEQSGAANGTCRAKASRQSDCKNPACDSDQVCAIGSDDKPACFKSLKSSTLAGIPEGNGLMPSIAYLDAVPVVVWYDQNTWEETLKNQGRLKGVIATSDSASAGPVFKPADIVVLDDGSVPNQPVTQRTNNVGQFASLAIGPADAAHRLAVAYFDVTSKQLKVLSAKPKNNTGWDELTTTTLRVADGGKGTPETDPVLFVGADTSLRFDSAKNLIAAYQDSTRGDLRVVQQTSTGQWSTPQVISGEGVGAGFYVNLLVDGANKYVTHAIIKAATASESANRLEVKKLP